MKNKLGMFKHAGKHLSIYIYIYMSTNLPTKRIFIEKLKNNNNSTNKKL